MDGFESIYFTAKSGLGYYTLSSQRQGLSCLDSRFIVYVDSISNYEMSSIENEELNTDVESLKLDYFYKSSIEMAVFLFLFRIKSLFLHSLSRMF